MPQNDSYIVSIGSKTQFRTTEKKEKPTFPTAAEYESFHGSLPPHLPYLPYALTG